MLLIATFYNYTCIQRVLCIIWLRKLTTYRLHEDVIVISDSEQDSDVSRLDVAEIDHFDGENDSIVSDDLEEQDTLYE